MVWSIPAGSACPDVDLALENQIYLGSEAWMKGIRKIVESKIRSDDHPRPHREVGRPKMAAIVAAVDRAFGVTEAWIRTTHGSAARLIAAWLAGTRGFSASDRSWPRCG